MRAPLPHHGRMRRLMEHVGDILLLSGLSTWFRMWTLHDGYRLEQLALGLGLSHVPLPNLTTCTCTWALHFPWSCLTAYVACGLFLSMIEVDDRFCMRVVEFGVLVGARFLEILTLGQSMLDYVDLSDAAVTTRQSDGGASLVCIVGGMSYVVRLLWRTMCLLPDPRFCDLRDIVYDLGTL